jgi:hypothetical protein
MAGNEGWEAIARILVDAADVDLQIYQGRLLRELRSTPSGDKIADWATRNRLAFEALLRAVSVAAQRLPKDRGLALDTARDQLARLPVELRRTFMADESSEVTGHRRDLLSDENFKRQYEAALEGLTDDELAYIASLSTERLREWVLSPASIRPHKIALWTKQKPLGAQVDQFLDSWAASAEKRGYKKRNPR